MQCKFEPGRSHRRNTTIEIRSQTPERCRVWTIFGFSRVWAARTERHQSRQVWRAHRADPLPANFQCKFKPRRSRRTAATFEIRSKTPERRRVWTSPWAARPERHLSRQVWPAHLAEPVPANIQCKFEPGRSHRRNTTIEIRSQTP